MNKGKKEELIEIRVTTKEKKLFKEILKEVGMEQDDFFRSLVFGESIEMQMQLYRFARIFVNASELVRYLQMNYSDKCNRDFKLKERVDNLWKILE